VEFPLLPILLFFGSFEGASSQINPTLSSVLSGDSRQAGLDGRGESIHKSSQCDGCDREVEDFTKVMNTDIVEDPIFMSEVEASLQNFIPSYQEVLTCSSLPIYSSGEILSNPGENIGKAEEDRGTLTSVSGMRMHC
jgi:hypothetical protein